MPGCAESLKSPGGAVLPTQAAGTGTRYIYQIDGTTGKFVLAGQQAL